MKYRQPHVARCKDIKWLFQNAGFAGGYVIDLHADTKDDEIHQHTLIRLPSFKLSDYLIWPTRVCGDEFLCGSSYFCSKI